MRDRERERHECGDKQLVHACLDGEQWAWDELVHRYGRLVYGILRRGGLSEADADDGFQNVFLLACRNLAQLRDQDRLSAWLITTTKRELWRLYRQRRADQPLDDALVDGGAPPLEEALRLEREQAVREALRRIDGRCRQLLTSLFLGANESTYRQIAEKLDIPIGSIGPTRARCFEKLEAILVEMGFDPGD